MAVAVDNRGAQFCSTTLWSLGQMVVLHAGALLATMFFTRYLGAAQYSVIPLMNSLMLLGVVILGLGVPGSLARFLAEPRRCAQQRQLLRRTLLVLLPWLVLATLLLDVAFDALGTAFAFEWLDGYRWIFLGIVWTELLRQFIEKVSHGLGVMRISARYSLYCSLLTLLIAFPLVWYNPSGHSALCARILALVLPSISALIALHRILAAASPSRSASNRPPRSADVVRYGLPLAAISLTSFGFVQADMLFLAFHLTEVDIGIYGAAIFLFLRLGVLARAIGYGLGPLYASSTFHAHNHSHYLVAALRYCLIIALPIALLLVVDGQALMGLLFGPDFSDASLTLSILSLYFLLSSLLGVLSPVLDFSGKASIRALGATLGVTVNLLLNALLIPEYGLAGAAWATVAGYAVFSLFVLRAIADLLPHDYWRDLRLFPLALTMLLTGSLAQSVHLLFGGSLQALLVNGLMVITLYPCLLLCSKVIDKMELVALLRHLRPR